MNYYFYDLETSGVNSRWSRIMQFGGQRTDLNLKPVGKPDNFLIKLTEDVLPDPEAILVHGITPQKTWAEGITEAEAVKYLSGKVFTPDTIIVGFNNIRFDDEFIRHLLWRNFMDAYEWQWKDHRSRWDLLDLTRMTRALRPEGIKWPFAPDGRPSNSLGLLTAVNKLEHVDAHDALSDVMASIALARLVCDKQTKLFEYLLKMRDKTKVAVLVGKNEPFVYSSGRYPSEYEKTTIAVMVAAHPDRAAALVYDLRVNPDEFTGLSVAQLATLWQLRGKDVPYFPVKKLSYNRSPAIAPLSILDTKSATRLHLNKAVIDKNLSRLRTAEDFGGKLVAALQIVEPKRQPELIINELTVDAQLYDGFVNGPDKAKMSVVRSAGGGELTGLKLDFEDERLRTLLPLYRARNFPDLLTSEQKAMWNEYKVRRLVENKALNHYLVRIDELSKESGFDEKQKNLLRELKTFGESKQ